MLGQLLPGGRRERLVARRVLAPGDGLDSAAWAENEFGAASADRAIQRSNGIRLGSFLCPGFKTCADAGTHVDS